jgi:cytochrome oxidase Cu insertion factor (SCO1/SenC/PrrC family)
MALIPPRAAVLIATLALTACVAPGGGSATSGSGAVSRGPTTAAGAVDSSQVGIEVGQRAPAFSVMGLDGRQVSDVDLRAQGKPYILYFYATW